jgi:hypothetical protein
MNPLAGGDEIERPAGRGAAGDLGKSPHPSCRNLFFVMQDTLIPRIDENIDGFIEFFGVL